jgi:hypothetical protein
MRSKRRVLVVPLVLTALLSGCAGAPADRGSNPLDDLKKVVEIAPWAKSIADNASAQEVQARVAELQATLSTLDVPQETKDEAAKRLAALSAELTTNPDAGKAAVTELRAIIGALRAATK